MADHHDAQSRPLPPLAPGQPVLVQQQPGGTWLPAQVEATAPGPRSYQVATPDGATLRRNRVHIHALPGGATVPAPVPISEAPAPPDLCDTPVIEQREDALVPPTVDVNPPLPPQQATATATRMDCRGRILR